MTELAKGGFTGLIPAGAGNTHRSLSNRPSTWAHPRRRGEHDQVMDRAGHYGGSSPQARGTQTLTSSRCSSQGLIPAGAGNTSTGETESPPE